LTIIKKEEKEIGNIYWDRYLLDCIPAGIVFLLVILRTYRAGG
jgi:hypothetical protein